METDTIRFTATTTSNIDTGTVISFPKVILYGDSITQVGNVIHFKICLNPPLHITYYVQNKSTYGVKL